MLVLGDVGQNPQLNLRIVRGQKDTVLQGWYKSLANEAALFQADWDILQIGVCRRKTAGLGQILDIAGMDFAILHDGLLQSDDIGGLELGDLTVFQDFRDHWGDRGQAFQNIYCSGVAGLGLLSQLQRQTHLFKEEDAQLLG